MRDRADQFEAARTQFALSSLEKIYSIFRKRIPHSLTLPASDRAALNYASKGLEKISRSRILTDLTGVGTLTSYEGSSGDELLNAMKNLFYEATDAFVLVAANVTDDYKSDLGDKLAAQAFDLLKTKAESESSQREIALSHLFRVILMLGTFIPAVKEEVVDYIYANPSSLNDKDRAQKISILLGVITAVLQAKLEVSNGEISVFLLDEKSNEQIKQLDRINRSLDYQAINAALEAEDPQAQEVDRLKNLLDVSILNFVKMAAGLSCHATSGQLDAYGRTAQSCILDATRDQEASAAVATLRNSIQEICSITINAAAVFQKPPAPANDETGRPTVIVKTRHIESVTAVSNLSRI